jgi:Bifunctional DNA primase/polymerase, N-terminal
MPPETATAPLTTAGPPDAETLTKVTDTSIVGGSAHTEQHARGAAEHAIGAARRGWAVFPCRPGDKRPLVDRWEQRAIADPERVAAHWPAGANVGIACGPSRLVVLDLDSAAHGELPADWRAIPGVVDGRDVFAQLLEWAGEQWPSTHWVATQSGGWHLYFETPDSTIRNSAGLLGPGVDVRAAGGYVVGAGSMVGGRAYEVLDNRPPAPLPGWLTRRLTSRDDRPVHQAPSGDGPANLRGLVQTVRDSQPGSRTDALVWAAHRLRDEIAAGRATQDNAELLVQAAVASGIRGGEKYARGQVHHVLGGSR